MWHRDQARVVPNGKVDPDGWSTNEIDLFILEKMRAHDLRPNGEAQRSTLVRRVYLDLIGMPPSLEETLEINSDHATDWYERMVDRLLSSPQFGVRWGRHWLDLVRYAESRGHEFDEDVPNAHHYRDYVVRALNQDVPYDRFVVEHIAGDLLENPRLHLSKGWNESVLGTGFWHLGEWVHSPVDTRKDETDRFDNMIDVFSKTFLGTTVACARCHDHKFDAIGADDYYALSGFLQSSHYRLVRFEAEQSDRLIAGQLKEVRRRYSSDLRNQLIGLLDWMSTRPEVAQRWFGRESLIAAESSPELAALKSSALPVDSTDERVRVDFRRMDGDVFRMDGPGAEVSDRGSFRLGSAEGVSLVPWTGIRKDPFWDRMRNLSERTNVQNRYVQVSEAGRTVCTSTFELKSGKLSYLVRGGVRAFAAMDSLRLIAGPLHGETLAEFGAPANEVGYRWVTHSLDRYRGKRTHVEFSPLDGQSMEVIQVIDGDAPISGSPQEMVLLKRLSRSENDQGLTVWKDWLANLPNSTESNSTEDLLIAKWLDRVLSEISGSSGVSSESPIPASWVSRWKETIAAWRQEEQKLASQAKWESQVSMGMIDGSGEDDHLLIRGNTDKPGPLVARRFLAALSDQSNRPDHSTSKDSIGRWGSGRMELAQRLIDSQNPLTARVIANRIWHHLLGRGIVSTTDDFGVLGQRPTHPELLDHLAMRLIEHDWSLKELVRDIVLSSTYRQSSRVPEGVEQLDPDNIWLSHARVRRLEGEAIRDSMFFVAGRLDFALEGRSVPVHLTDFLQGRGRPGVSGPVDGQGRRSLFTAVRRNFLVPMMTTFDAPVPFSAMGRRNVSNVPAQSLMLLNDPLVHDLSKSWGDRVLKLPLESDRERINRMFEMAFGRRPVEREQKTVLEFIEAERSAGENDASQIYQQVAHMLFNTKEFIFRF